MPAKIELTRPGWSGTLVFDKLDFLPALPPETWQPAPDQTDVVHLNPPRFKQLLDLLTRNLSK